MMDGLLTDQEATVGTYINFSPKAVSSRIDRGDRAAYRCTEGATLTEMEVTVGTYQCPTSGREQSRSRVETASR